ncbi:MAG: AsmA family protein [Candidatus Omnitrophota bacterium]
MNKILAVFFGVLLIAAAGAVIFVATFDANRYRPALVQKIEQVLGKPVRLDKIGLVWNNGIGLSIKGFAVYADSTRTKTALSLDQGSANLRIAPLLHKKIQIASLALSGLRMNVNRAADGTWAIPGVPRQGLAGDKPSAGATLQPAMMPLSIDLIRLENGQINYRDNSNKPPLDLEIGKIDATLTHFNTSEPFKFLARAAMFSQTQNIDLAGTLLLPKANSPGIVNDVTLKILLHTIEMSRMLESLPMTSRAGIGKDLKGDLRIDVAHLVLDATAADTVKAAIRLTDAQISLDRIGSPVERIQLDSMLDKNELTVKNFSAGYAQGFVSFSGIVRQLTSPSPKASVNAAITNVSLKTVMPPQSLTGPVVAGLLSANFSGSASGAVWPEVSKTMNGSGRLRLRNVTIANFNILREVFMRLEAIPGIAESLRAKLPPDFSAKIDATDTQLAPIDVPVTISDGRIRFDSLRLATDQYVLEAQGEFGLDRSIGAQAILRINAELSNAAVKAVNELRYFQNSQGEFQIPVQIKGTLSDIKIIPDLKYAAQRLAMDKAQEMVTGLLNQSLKSKSKQPQEPASANDSGDPKTMLADYLQKALKQSK